MPIPMNLLFFASLMTLVTVAASAQTLQTEDGPSSPSTNLPSGEASGDSAQDQPAQAPPEASGQAIVTPDKTFLKAYELIKTARQSLSQNDREAAKADMTTALDLLSSIQKEFPQWNRDVVKQYIEFSNQLLAIVTEKAE